MLNELKRFEEAKSLLRKSIPVARRVLGESHELTLKMSYWYAGALRLDPGATLDDHREAVKTLAESARIACRVLGGAHPFTPAIEKDLQNAHAALALASLPGGRAALRAARQTSSKQSK